MKRISILIFLITLLVLSCPTTAPTIVEQKDTLPLDPAVVTGQLENGLRYYIRPNKKPEQRVEMRLVVNAGSILEEDNEQGIAHLLEHLAFKGTLHFKKDALIDALEAMGMRFGNDLNASTGYDETIYRLTVPTGNPQDIETGLLVLEDWAHNIVLDRDEVEKERKVIIEERRSALSAEERTLEKHLKALFKDSRYASRRPIGDIEVLKKIPQEAIAHFYRTWYRPDLMAVIIVGDVDPAGMEKKILDHFGGLKKSSSPLPRSEYQVPSNSSPIVSVFTDKEATSSSFRLYFKRPSRPLITISDYRTLLVESLFHNMLSARLEEIARKPDSPFLNAYSGQGRLVRTIEVVVLGAVTKEGKIESSLQTVLAELERVRRFGFTASELERNKQNSLASIEQSYNERDKRDSARLVGEYIRLFLEREASPGIEYEYSLYRRYIPQIGLEEINALTASLFPDENRVLLVAAPEKTGLAEPDPARLVALFDSVKNMRLAPYTDQALDYPLVAVPPKSGTVVSTGVIQEAGITEWRLSNGIRVLLKPTDFKNDEIILQAWKAGGLSLAPDAEYIPALTAADLVNMSGLGEFDRTQLEKKLAGKQVKAGVWIEELHEGISGSTRPADLETMCQLVWLYFTKAKIDPDMFLTYREKLADSLAQRNASPENVFSDTIQTTISQNHPRSRPLTPSIIPLLDSEASYRFYKDRFSDAGDFTFIFVGNFSPETIRPLVETYIASLPASGKKENWKDVGIRRPPGVVDRAVRMGQEPKSMIALIFHGDFNWQMETVVALRALSEVVELRLTDRIREEEGGTYGLGVWDYPRRLPRQEYLFFINFGTDPARVDELTGKVLAELEKLATTGPTEEEVNKTRELIYKERELYLKNNSFWTALIKNYTIYGESPARILEYATHVKGLSVGLIKDLARQYLRNDQYVRVVLYPENSK